MVILLFLKVILLNRNEELKMITNGVKLSDFEDIYLQIDLKYEKNKNEQKSSRNYGNKIF